jgi:hypothetical protein
VLSRSFAWDADEFGVGGAGGFDFVIELVDGQAAGRWADAGQRCDIKRQTLCDVSFRLANAVL